jgi:hypothetical protein
MSVCQSMFDLLSAIKLMCQIFMKFCYICKFQENVLNGSYTSLHGTNALLPILSIFT